MQVSIENVGKLGRKLTVRLPAQELEDKVRSRIQETGRSARLKGFRPGKVPTKVIEQRFGRQIRGEVLSEMIGSSFQQAVTQEKLRPAVQPAIQTTGTPTNGEIEYTATFEVMPEIGTIDISGLEIVKPTSSVTDADNAGGTSQHQTTHACCTFCGVAQAAPPAPDPQSSFVTLQREAKAVLWRDHRPERRAAVANAHAQARAPPAFS